MAPTSERPSESTGLSLRPSLSVASTQVGWVLLPLRAFLAFVFLYAGISKVADRTFLDDHSPTGIHAQLIGVRGASPVGSLLGPVQDHSLLFGVLFSIAEIAVGLGLLLAIFTRIAALGGMLLSLSFFLTVSWQSTPWYTGADIGYLFAMTPLLIGGAGGLYSFDAWLAAAAHKRPGVAADRTRRALVLGSAAVGALVLLGIATLARGSKKNATVEPVNSGDSSATDAIELASASAVAVGAAKQVKDPKNGHPTWVLQLAEGKFTALDAVCPHEQCTVGFVSPTDGFACPCHGSRFHADGSLINGPATRGLTSIPVTVVDGTVRRA
jgi:thiosulfate dehydrogenase [quinone] large subunit